MRLPIRHKYFQDIKNGKKLVEIRDAHLTLIDITTEEILRVDVSSVSMIQKKNLSIEQQASGMFSDDKQMVFTLKPIMGGEKNEL